MSVQALQDYTFHSKYARYNPQLKRRETFDEATDRAMNMHIERLPQIADEIRWAFDQVKAKRVLGSQRALQYAGEPLLRKNARGYNCFGVDTPFVTSVGVRRFTDYVDGETVTVLTHTGCWKKAAIRNFGPQKLNTVVLRRGQAEHTVDVTPNHRWLLKQGGDTTALKVGDELLYAPNIFTQFEYDAAPPDERLYWAYGYVYGDGTMTHKAAAGGDATDRAYSMCRLCGNDVKYLPRFQELGFKDSSSQSLHGDVMVYTGSYQKSLPNPETDEPRLIRAFVRGFLDADGEKNRNDNPTSPFLTIQATGTDSIEFIRNVFPMAGVYVVSETDYSGQETNFGVRSDETVRFRIINGFGHSAASFRVDSIVESGVEDVWCLEVADDHSFVLPFGLSTGNCTVSYCDRIRFFQEALWLLLCGSGVGFSVQLHHIAKLPDFSPSRSLPYPRPTRTYVISDSIEGWADALGILMATYFPHPQYPEWQDVNVNFDYSLIRAKGSPLSSGAGKAPGPEPLMKSLEAIRALLARTLASGLTRLRSIDAYDVMMHASDAVLSGGVRRSASICIFSITDMLMMKAKTGDWTYTNPQRARSNNSVLLLRNRTTQHEFHDIIASVKEYGEPGFIWSDSTEMIFNPCVEVGMYPVDVTTGLSGWEFCNLCEINGKKCVSREDFAIAARAAAIIGTVQASYTDFAYLGEVTERIVRREALLGVSITGMMENPAILFDPELQREMATLVKEVNLEIAQRIGINPAARATCVKPAGTTSCIFGTSSGIHAHHAKRYIRRTQANMLEAPYQFFKKHNPRAVEKSVWSKNGTDGVISFCIEPVEGAITRKELPATGLLSYVSLTQQNWVNAGKTEERCTQPWLRHNVSNTINVKDGEWESVEQFIYDNREHFAGVSLLSHSGDLDYQQAPFTAIHTPTEITEMYGDGSLMASGLIVDGLHVFSGNLWHACDAVLGVFPQDLTSAQQDWIRRAKQFTTRYFRGHIKQMTYCLKEVNNWKLWCDLQRETVTVDYRELIEEEDNTKIEETIACAGGVCEISFPMPVAAIPSGGNLIPATA